MNKRIRKKRKALKLFNTINDYKIIRSGDCVVFCVDSLYLGSSTYQLREIMEYLYSIGIHSVAVPKDSSGMLLRTDKQDCISALKNMLYMLEHGEGVGMVVKS